MIKFWLIEMLTSKLVGKSVLVGIIILLIQWLGWVTFLVLFFAFILIFGAIKAEHD